MHFHYFALGTRKVEIAHFLNFTIGTRKVEIAHFLNFTIGTRKVQEYQFFWSLTPIFLSGSMGDVSLVVSYYATAHCS